MTEYAQYLQGSILWSIPALMVGWTLGKLECVRQHQKRKARRYDHR